MTRADRVYLAAIGSLLACAATCFAWAWALRNDLITAVLQHPAAHRG